MNNLLPSLMANPMHSAMLAGCALVINNNYKPARNSYKEIVAELITNIAVAIFVSSATGASLPVAGLLAAVPLFSRGCQQLLLSRSYLTQCYHRRNLCNKVFKKFNSPKLYAAARLVSSGAFLVTLGLKMKSAPITMATFTFQQVVTLGLSYLVAKNAIPDLRYIKKTYDIS